MSRSDSGATTSSASWVTITSKRTPWAASYSKRQSKIAFRQSPLEVGPPCGTRARCTRAERRAASAHRRDGEIVIPIRADEEIVIGVLDGGQVAPQHPPDDAVLPPQRNQNGDPPLGSPGCLNAVGQWKRRSPLGKMATSAMNRSSRLLSRIQIAKPTRQTTSR